MKRCVVCKRLTPRKFCSEKCRNIYKQKKEELKKKLGFCVVCGERILKEDMFCTEECEEKYNKKKKFCKHCGKEFYARWISQEYCSDICHRTVLYERQKQRKGK